ncbi:hypothetical protein [Neopusillimonas maritima]|jgi:predicted membrane protein|uniref:Uncharacterized protein n=1 Tax=Neopusillimonas maritima TaxID=2026239 RepID=A0ABX9N0L3_9BURK|nr:hypothetical protein [Neopusillimonas maritima]RII83854.1 hypothetical protein CJO09_01015 [Neopusillimonas maritima]
MEKGKHKAEDFELVKEVVSKDEFKKIRKAATNVLYTVQSSILFFISIPFCIAGVLMSFVFTERRVSFLFANFDNFMGNLGEILFLIMVVWFIVSPLVIGLWAICSWRKYNESQRFLNKHVAERAEQIRIQNNVAYERKLEMERQRQRSMSDGMVGLS